MKKTIFLIILIGISFYIYAQEIEAKFVSKLKIIQRDNIVCITWKNPANFADILEVYRSNNIINSEAELNSAVKIAELYGAEEEYNDLPPAGQNYYAVIIRNAHNNIRNIILIPFRNYTFKPVIIKQEKVLTITYIGAFSEGNHIKINWDFEGVDNNKTISIYRSLSPINSDFALAQSIKIANVSITSLTYTDMPVSNINYYYGVFISDEIKHSYKPKVNVTNTPVYIVESTEIMVDFDMDNFIPLPLLTFTEDPITGKPIKKQFLLKSPNRISCSIETENMNQEMRNIHSDVQEYLNQKNYSLTKKLGFCFLEDESTFVPQEYSQEYKIVQQLLQEQDYLNALFTLENMLCEPLSVVMRDRVLYYAGVIYYLQGDYKKAYIYLVLPLESYRNEVSPYLTSIHTVLYQE